MSRKQLLWLAASMLCFCAALPAHAINKCTGPDGKVTYQDAECVGGKGETLKTVDSRSDSFQPSYATGASGGRTVHTGPRGGQFYYNQSGNKTYVSRGKR